MISPIPHIAPATQATPLQANQMFQMHRTPKLVIMPAEEANF